MRKYETPEADVIWFETEDIVTTSITEPPIDPGDSDWE